LQRLFLFNKKIYDFIDFHQKTGLSKQDLCAVKNIFQNTLNYFTMKLLTTITLFFLLTFSLIAQNQSVTQLKPLKKTGLNFDWQRNATLQVGINGTYTEGVLKNFIASPIAINMGFEVHTPHIFGFTLTARLASLRQTFTNNNHVWPKDTTITLATIQGSAAYQFWQSKHTTLYLFGALGVHSLSAGKSRQNDANGNCTGNCESRDKEWLLISFAPSVGFFFDFRQKGASQIMGGPNHNSYYRLKYAANLARFQYVGSGVFHDMGVAYVF
jgi:hypothetical protein